MSSYIASEDEAYELVYTITQQLSKCEIKDSAYLVTVDLTYGIIHLIKTVPKLRSCIVRFINTNKKIKESKDFISPMEYALVALLQYADMPYTKRDSSK